MQYLNNLHFKKNLSRFVFAPHKAKKETDAVEYQKFFDAGGNVFHLHGEGGETTTRTLFGQWVTERKISDEIFVFSQLAHDDGDDPANFEDSRFSKTRLEQEIRDNLALIQKDCIEAIYFGGDNETYSVENILESMHHQIELDLVHHFGVYNWTPSRITELQTAAKSKGLQGFSFIITTELCIATPTSPIWEGYVPFDASMETVVKKNNLLVLAWSTDFNQSLFIPNAFDPKVIPENRQKSRWHTPENIALMKTLESLSAKTNVTFRQINLAWMLNRDFDTLMVIYEDMPPYIEEAMSAFAIKLPDSF